MADRLLPPIEYSTYINVAPGVVYDTLATAEGWNSWFTTTATVDARAGGSYRFHWENWAAERETVTLEGPVVEAEPASAFAFRWQTGEAMTTVRFALSPRALARSFG